MKNYMDGAWVEARGSFQWTSRSPGDQSDVLGEFVEDLEAADASIVAARKAQEAWEDLGQEARNQHLEAFGRELAARKDEIARTIAREVGKPLWESSGEAGALTGKVKVTLNEAMDEVRGKLMPGSSTWVNGGYRYRPLGVCVVPGPFNFPLHLANGHILAALATGNTCIFKPSEMAPRCAELYMEAAHAAGLPAGVLNMVQGGPEAGKRLVSNDDVDAVLFTGSLRAGVAIRKETVEQPWKLLALEMGGKNTAVVLSDANVDRAAYEIAQGALMTCGQRCTGTSRVIVQESLAAALEARLKRIWEQVSIGHPLDDKTFMGPIINAASKARFLNASETARAEGMEEILPNREFHVEGYEGFYVSPALWRAEGEPSADGPHSGCEIFGPDVVLHVCPDGDDETAARWANATHYGLAMSVFSHSEERFMAISKRLRTGILNFNRATAGATALMPFGGVKGSGNHRPAAVMAARNCTYPVATLRLPEALKADDVMARFPTSALFP